MIGGTVVAVSACKSANQRFFTDSTDYSSAKELPPLKFPAHSLAVSNRYDIPSIPNENGPIITEITPPDY